MKIERESTVPLLQDPEDYDEESTMGVMGRALDNFQKTESSNLLDLKQMNSKNKDSDIEQQKKMDEEKEKEKEDTFTPKIFSRLQVVAAYGVFTASVIFFCFSHISVQYLGGAVPENELNAIRFGVGIPMSAVFLGKVDSRLIARKQWLVFVCVVVLGCAYNATLYTAAAHAPLGVVGGLSIATAIVTNALLSICIKSERQLSHYISAVIAVTGIFLLAQPDFIFHTGEHPSVNVTWVSPCVTDNHIESQVEAKAKSLGLLLACISGVVMALKMQAMSKITETHDPFTVTFWLSVFATLVSSILMAILEHPTVLVGWFCIGALLLHCISMSQYVLCLIYTLNRLPVLATNLIASLELPVLLVSQYTFLSGILPGRGNWMEILGAVLCFLGSTGCTLIQLVITWRKKKYEEKL